MLVGTISIEKSELLSKMLKRRGIKHEVLNAKYHDKEAEIVAQAGKKGCLLYTSPAPGSPAGKAHIFRHTACFGSGPA